MNLISLRTPAKTLFTILAVVVFSIVSSFDLQAQEDGEKLFKSYCASCHSPGNNALVGPGLAGVYDKYDREWLYSWIKNSQALVTSGDEQAVAVYEQYNKVLMPNQPVNNEQIDAILTYVKEYNEAAPVVEASSANSTEVVEEGDAETSPYFIAAIVFGTFNGCNYFKKSTTLNESG